MSIDQFIVWSQLLDLVHKNFYGSYGWVVNLKKHMKLSQMGSLHCVIHISNRGKNPKSQLGYKVRFKFSSSNPSSLWKRSIAIIFCICYILGQDLKNTPLTNKKVCRFSNKSQHWPYHFNTVLDACFVLLYFYHQISSLPKEPQTQVSCNHCFSTKFNFNLGGNDASFSVLLLLFMD